MAEAGIDRKLDERMEFTTSKDVTVAPTFTDSEYPYIEFWIDANSGGLQCT